MAGYSGFSKSNNAIDAENSGRFPATEIARRLKVKSAAVKAICETGEYHHTSSWFNKTLYYDLEDCREKLAELKAWKPVPVETEIRENCTVKYLDWGGSRKHPTATEMVIENCRAEKKGDWWTITTPGGRTFRKNENTNGFSIA